MNKSIKSLVINILGMKSITRIVGDIKYIITRYNHILGDSNKKCILTSTAIVHVDHINMQKSQHRKMAISPMLHFNNLTK